MQIIQCDNSHAKTWDDYVSRQEQASFYHLFGWKAVNEASFGHRTFYLAAVDQGAIRGVFPLVCLQDRKSTRLNSSHSQQSRMPSSA